MNNNKVYIEDEIKIKNVNKKELLEDEIALNNEKLQDCMIEADELRRNIHDNKVYLPVVIGTSISLANYLLSYVFSCEGIYVGNDIDLSKISFLNGTIDYNTFMGLLGGVLCIPASIGISVNKYIEKCSNKEELIKLEREMYKYKNEIGNLLNRLNTINTNNNDIKKKTLK